MHRKKCSKW